MSKAIEQLTPIGTAARALALVIGTTAAGLQAIGAFEMQHLVEGGINYLVVAAPTIVIAAAVIPYIAESAWRERQRIKSLALWITFLFVGAVVFFNNSERMHAGKANAEAERLANHTAAGRAETALAVAKAELKTAQTAADKVRGWDAKACTAKCLSIRATEVAARARVTEAEGTLRRAQGSATAEAALKAPVWLTPFSLDWLTFTAGWYGLGLFRRTAKPVEAKPVAAKTTKKTGKATRKPRSPFKNLLGRPKLHVVAANQN